VPGTGDRETARRWIGLHVAALGFSGLIVGPVSALHDLTGWGGWLAVNGVITWVPVAFAQSRTRGLPLSFWLWAGVTLLGYGLGYLAWDAAFDAWVDLFKGRDGSVRIWGAIVVACLSFGIVFALVQGLTLAWKIDAPAAWFWTSMVAAAQSFAGLFAGLETLALFGWKERPVSSSLIIACIGAVRGLLLGAATFLPLRRLRERMP
jgi:hypothetical protein